MTLSTDYIFITNEVEGFRECREKRTTSASTMTTILCTKGYIDVFYHGEMIRINADDLFVRIPDFSQELGPYEMSSDFEFLQVTISASIFNQIMYDHMRIEPNWYAKQEYLKAHPIFHANPVMKDFYMTYFHLLELRLRGHLTDYRKLILNQIAHAATMEMLNYMDKLETEYFQPSQRLNSNHSDYTFHEFMRLLQQYPHEREVQWYAEKLNITPKYLSEICKQRSGKSAGEWIADITVSEIKYLLRNTTLPIREVARMMEFPNASFFCQYTKKHTGMTPNHYRKEKR